MDPSHESLHFYVKAVTGLLLLMNLALLVSIRFGMNWAKQLTAKLPETEQAVVWPKASRSLGFLIIVVIAMNAAAIFANYQLRQSAAAVAAVSGASSSVVLTQSGTP